MPGNRVPRSAVLAPGGNYGAEGPLLMYAKLAVERRGGQARALTWQHSAGQGFTGQRERAGAQVAAAADEMAVATGAAPVVIGKSLGSLAAAVAADQGLAAVWFTPLLTDEPAVAALRRARPVPAGRRDR